jgi:hypothetical protein
MTLGGRFHTTVANIGDATNDLILRRPAGASKDGGQGSAASASGRQLEDRRVDSGGFPCFRACGPSFEARLWRAPQDEAVDGGNQMHA